MDILWAHTVRYRVYGVKLMIVTANLLADHPHLPRSSAALVLLEQHCVSTELMTPVAQPRRTTSSISSGLTLSSVLEGTQSTMFFR